MEALRQLFWSSRPISWINTAFPFGLAYWLATGDTGVTLWFGVLFFLIPYNLLMYGINDVFDYESDLRNPRKGGIEGALLDPKWHSLTLKAAVWSCLPFIGYLTVVGNSVSTGILYFTIFMVIAYSAKGLRFKEKPFLDSITSSIHFVGPLVFALTLANVNLGEPAFFNSIAAFTLWGAASHAFGAVQDVVADRIGGIASIATVIGARSTVRLSVVAYAIAAVILTRLNWPYSLAALAAVPYLLIVAPFWNITDASCERANAGWKKFIWLNFIAGAIITLLVI
jgi:4-hydroxybenzoate polyprenyltransferase